VEKQRWECRTGVLQWREIESDSLVSCLSVVQGVDGAVVYILLVRSVSSFVDRMNISGAWLKVLECCLLFSFSFLFRPCVCGMMVTSFAGSSLQCNFGARLLVQKGFKYI